jgi:hypothetical protein
MRRIYTENFPSEDRFFRIEGFRDGDTVIVRIYEIVEQNEILIPQFRMSASINEIHDANLFGVDAFKEMVESAKQTIRDYDMLKDISEKEADLFLDKDNAAKKS